MPCVSSVESSRTCTASRSREYSMRATASMSRSTTYISLKTGSWMVTRRLCEPALRRGDVALVLVIEVRHHVPVRAVDAENQQDQKIGREKQHLHPAHRTLQYR